MKDIQKILDANPSLAKEVAKLLKEELESALQAPAAEATPEQTDLTLPEVATGTNDNEVRPDAPSETPSSEETNGEGHTADQELTPEDPITAEQVDEMVADVPVEELEGEAEALEDSKDEDAKEVEELDNVIEEATALKAKVKERIVFTESVINKVNARILTEAAKLIANKKSLTEGQE